MAFEGDLTNLGLADIFQTLGMNRQSGTLVVKHGELERRFYFTDEGVSLLTSRSARKFRLGNLLLGMGKLQEPDLKVAVLKQERSRETKFGDILIQTGLVKDEDIKEACRYQSAEEIYESFSWKSGKFQFLEGANAGPAGGPGPFAEFFFNVTDVVMEAARRADEYALNLSKIGDFQEFWKRKEPGPLPEDKAGRPASLLHGLLDGTLDVGQVFEEFPLSSFDSAMAFTALIEAGLIAPMGAPDLEAAAQPFLAARQHERAARLLARASHHDPKNAALLQSLADTQASGGDKKEAGKTLTALGRVLAETQQRTEAVEALRKAVEYDRSLEAAYELLMDVYASLEQQDKAEDACREAARLLSDDRSFDSALRLLDRGLAMVPTSVHLRLARANCLLAMDRRPEGLQELAGIAKSLEEHKGEDPKLLLGIFRKLQQLDPDNAAYKGRVESLLAGEKAREARKRILKAAAVIGGILLAAGAWFLLPRSAEGRLEDLEARVAEHPAFTKALEPVFDEMAAEADALRSKFEDGSDQEVRLRGAATQIANRRAAPERAAKVKALEERIRNDILSTAAGLLQKGEYPAGIRRTVQAHDVLNGPDAAALQGEEYPAMRTRILEEVRKALAVPADALRGEWKTIQAALDAVATVDLQKADEEKQRQVFDTAGRARDARGRSDWPATVDALADAIRVFGEIEGIRITELRAILEKMDSTAGTIEDTYHRARAGVMYAELRRLYTETLREVKDSKERGDVARGIAACKAFLGKCETLRKEEPKEYFAPYVERVFDVLKYDSEIRESLTSLDAARAGLESAKAAEARGDLQEAFDTLRRTIAAAQDVNFQGLVLLPLRVSSRPEGAKVTVALPGQAAVEAGTTPLTLRYPYQGTTTIRVEFPGFEPSTLERVGVGKDRKAVVTVELQRTLRWRREAGDAVEGRPGLAPGLVLVGTRGGLFRALDAASGDERFQIKTDHLSGISGGILVDGSSAYFGGNDGEAFAVDITKGAIRWRKKTGSAVASTPVRVGELAVFGDSDGKVHAFRAASGDDAWAAALRSPLSTDPLAVGELILVPLADGRLVALRAADGSEAWTRGLAGPAASLVADGRGGVLATTDASTVDRVILASGQAGWSSKTDAPVRSRPMLLPDGFLAVSSLGTLHWFGPDGEEKRPRSSLGRAIEGGCSVLGDTLYAAAEEGTLVAWDLKGGRVSWALGGLGQLHGEPAVDAGILVVASAGSAGAVVVLDP